MVSACCKNNRQLGGYTNAFSFDLPSLFLIQEVAHFVLIVFAWGEREAESELMVGYSSRSNQCSCHTWKYSNPV